jgi:hypothetical protein
MVVGIAGSNPTRGTDVCLFVYTYVVLSCVGRGFCNELITRPKESYHESNNIRETSKTRP